MNAVIAELPCCKVSSSPVGRQNVARYTVHPTCGVTFPSALRMQMTAHGIDLTIDSGMPETVVPLRISMIR